MSPPVCAPYSYHNPQAHLSHSRCEGPRAQRLAPRPYHTWGLGCIQTPQQAVPITHTWGLPCNWRWEGPHVINMLPLNCIFGQGYCYNCALLFTTNFLSWPMETTSLPPDGVLWYCWNYFSRAVLGRNTLNTVSVHQPKAILEHQSQPSPHSNLACNPATIFPNHPHPSKCPSTFSNLHPHPLFQAPIPAQPTQQPRMQPRNRGNPRFLATAN